MNIFGASSASSGGRGRNDNYNQMDDAEEDIALYEEELRKGIDSIRKDVEQLGRLSGEARLEKANDINTRLQRMNTVFRSFKVELGELDTVEVKAAWEKKADKHRKALQRLDTEFLRVKADGDRDDLMAGNSSEANPENMTPMQLINQAQQVQNASTESVDRSKRMIEEAKQTGMETAVKLKAQTEQMKNIDSEMSQVQANLKQADSLIRSLMKTFMTDKLIMCWLFCIFCGIIFIVIYHGLVPEDDSVQHVPDHMLPPI